MALLLLLAAFALEVIVTRFWVDGGIPSAGKTAFDYLKFVFIFFSVGQALGLLREINREARESAGVNGYFGLNHRKGTVLFVLPVFEAKEKTEILRHHPSERDSQRFEVADPTLKVLNDTLFGAFCRYDVVAAMEMAMLLSDAGGQDFMVLDDRSFLVRLAELKQKEETDDTFVIKRGTGQADIVSVIVIGLWSNLVTTMLSSSKGFCQLHLDDCTEHDEDEPEIRSLQVGVHSMCTVTYNSDHVAEEGEPAVVLRREFKEFILTIVGGLSSTGTLRVGDLLLRDHGALAKLLNQFSGGSSDNTFTTVVGGRPAGSRRRSFTRNPSANQSGRLDPTSFAYAFDSAAKLILEREPSAEALARDPVARAAVERLRKSDADTEKIDLRDDLAASDTPPRTGHEHAGRIEGEDP